MSIALPTQHLRGVLPIASFLHQPRTMPRPVWLMLGSAFVLHDSALPAKLQEKWRGKGPILVTCAHTFAPWRIAKVNIPEDMRKARFVIGKAMAFDAQSQAIAGKNADLGILAVHPKLDIALCAGVKPGQLGALLAEAPGSFTLESLDAQQLPAGANKTAGSTAAASAPGSETGTIAPSPTTVHCIGFRGRGKLGEPEHVPTEEQIKKMSHDEKLRLQKEQGDAVGRQDGCVGPLRPFKEGEPLGPTAEFPDRPGGGGVANVIDFDSGIYSGMSGSPLVLDRPAAGFEQAALAAAKAKADAAAADAAALAEGTLYRSVETDTAESTAAATSGSSYSGMVMPPPRPCCGMLYHRSQTHKPYDALYVTAAEIRGWLDSM